MSIQEYADRQYDVLAFRGIRAVGEVALDETLFSEISSGEICTGIAKLVQAWLVAFLTETGSMLYQPDFGCDFMIDVKLGRLRTEADVLTAFQFASIQLRRVMASGETDTTPEDEQYAGAVLEQIVITPGSLQLRIQINSVAGTARKVILPIDILP